MRSTGTSDYKSENNLRESSINALFCCSAGPSTDKQTEKSYTDGKIVNKTTPQTKSAVEGAEGNSIQAKNIYKFDMSDNKKSMFARNFDDTSLEFLGSTLINRFNHDIFYVRLYLVYTLSLYKLFLAILFNYFKIYFYCSDSFLRMISFGEK